MYYSDFVMQGSYLAHHGIKGQKWGVRRYQNYDGTRTNAGKMKYKDELQSRVEKAKKSDRSKILRQESLSNIKKGIGNHLKITAGQIGVGLLAGGAAAVATMLAGPAAGVTIGQITMGTSIAADTVGIGLKAANAIRMFSRHLTIAELANKYDVEDIRVRVKS